MPRTARKDLGTTYFHIIVQGINREYIFRKKEYIKKYLELLKEKNNSNTFKILAYCMMNNHAHILIYTEKILEMSNAMQSIIQAMQNIITGKKKE